MRFRNSIRLFMENFRHVYKLFLYKAIIALVAIALCCAFVLPEIMELWKDPAMQGLIADCKAFAKMFFELNRESLESAKQEIVGPNGSLRQVLTLISSMRTEIILTVVGVVIVYLIKRFAETLCHFTTGSMLNDKMATYAETSFSTSSVANLGKASVYALAYVPLVFLFDALIILGIYGLWMLLPIFPALFCSMTLLVLCQALKMTIFSNWMPAMTTDNMRLREAIRTRGKKENGRQWTKAFLMYFVTVYAIIVINGVAAVFTFGSALIVTVPASYFFLTCEQYVHYYTIMGKKYFVTFESITANPDYGDSEHFFEYVDVTEKEGTQQEQTDENAAEAAVEAENKQ
ncbi:MAG: hypothetical protein IJX49_04620 [Clostridia bacterium]|nr:hypothetical protein [Clostridia bacterium]